MRPTCNLDVRTDTPSTSRVRTTPECPDSSQVDPLVAAAICNTNNSPLFKLPDKVLLRIMEQLDPIGLQCLRRTSRLFLRLFGDSRFRNYHFTGDTLRGSLVFTPWAVARPVHAAEGAGQSLYQLLEQDTINNSICSACRENREVRLAWHRSLSDPRKSDDWKRCGPCGLYHPPGWFSRIRRCIGSRGYVRLCEHEHDGCVITWKTVIRYAKQLARIDVPEPARVRVLVCRDASHLPSHHMHHHDQHHTNTSTEAAGRCYAKSRCFPSITMIGSLSTAVKLEMEWTGFLKLPDKYERLESIEMARLLAKFRQNNPPAEFILPQPGPGPLPEMRCFDPNKCRCLHYVGQENFSRAENGNELDENGNSWQLAPVPAEDMKRNMNYTCRPCQRVSSSPVDKTDGVMTGLNTHGIHTARTIVHRNGGSHTHTQVDINPCMACPPTPTHRGGDSGGQRPSCLAITYRRSILIAGEGEFSRAVTQSWFEAIDSRSHTGTVFPGDNEARPFDVLACPDDDPACANYFRYSHRPVVKEWWRQKREQQRPGRLEGQDRQWATAGGKKKRGKKKQRGVPKDKEDEEGKVIVIDTLLELWAKMVCVSVWIVFFIVIVYLVVDFMSFPGHTGEQD